MDAVVYIIDTPGKLNLQMGNWISSIFPSNSLYKYIRKKSRIKSQHRDTVNQINLVGVKFSV